jgi:light-regulated signal transduction histidine kinase (bacteriophytochrome)
MGVDNRHCSRRDRQAIVPITTEHCFRATGAVLISYQSVLKLRLEVSSLWFQRTWIVLGVTFALALILFAIHYRLISVELEARKRAEEELLFRNRELVSANKELDAFSYSVSHDLRNPLRSIEGFTAILIEDYQNKLDPEAKTYLQNIRLFTAKMAKMINDLLSLSRVSRTQLIRQEINLGALAEQIIYDLRQAEPERDLTFVVPSDIRVAGDPGLLRIALENLLRNAWKFTSKQSRAVIEVGTILHGSRTAYFVRDNGIGFDMRQANRLFKPFHRLHSVDEFGGTGIGLSTTTK